MASLLRLLIRVAPPVFDTIDNQADGYVGCMLAYIGTGKERTQYLICAGTGAKQCGCVMDSGDFTWALCPFNVMPDGETYYYP